MKIAVVSHKLCWASSVSPSGYATDGGFPLQVDALSRLFDTTIAALPVAKHDRRAGTPLSGVNLVVVPLDVPGGRGWRRKIAFFAWVMKHWRVLLGIVKQVDAVHVPIPGDVGTLGLLLALAARKPLFVRHCGNWLRPVTVAEHAWKMLMELTAGGKNVMMATGGGVDAPSRRNPHIQWVFSTSLTRDELARCATKHAWPGSRGPRLVIACRQDVEKGTAVVIDSLPLIRSFAPEVTLDVIGDGRDLTAFKARASELGLSDIITFHGKLRQAHVIELLKRADVFCYPTAASEGFPKVVIEALACGLPVITTPVSVLPHLVGSECGIVIERREPEDVANAVRWCVEDRDRYESLSSGAVSVASEYSLERWRNYIRGYLETAWQCRLRDEN